MTTVATIIQDAYRRGNLISINTSPTSLEQAEALRYLSRITKSVFGAEAGELLEPLPLGQNNIQRPSAYPWYGDSPPAEWYVPENQRLMCNLEAPTTVYLHPQPDDGARLGVIDVSGNFSTNTLTLNGNGRKIQGNTSVTLNTNGANQEWFFRGDLGEWVLMTPITDVSQTFPFPEEFDDYFIALLALAINPTQGIDMDNQTQAMMQRSLRQLRARYKINIPVGSELGLTVMPRTSQDRNYWYRGYNMYPSDPTALFRAGVPW